MPEVCEDARDGKKRCAWCVADPDYLAYHDREWGVPARHDRRWFEMLILEGAQAGLSWLTVLKRRPAYAKAYAGWDPARVAQFDEREREYLLSDASGIVRNRLKIDASIANAARFLETADEFDSFNAYIWRFTEGRVLRPEPPPRCVADLPPETPLSRALSKDLRQRGFRFVGPVICYALMQACGMVNDHMAGCYRLEELGGEECASLTASS